jgi:hypothetical protein
MALGAETAATSSNRGATQREGGVSETEARMCDGDDAGQDQGERRR